MENSLAEVPSPPVALTERRYSFKFHGMYPDFLVLMLKNTFLTLVTLGFYYAWARTARRNYLWQNTEFDGHRLEYTGLARDLFRAYVKVAIIYGAFIGLSAFLQSIAPLVFLIFRIVFAIGFFFIVPWAVYRARAYLITHTRWRGIRLGMERDAAPYMMAFIRGWGLSIATLGIYTPWRMNQLHRVITERTRIGTWNLVYDGVDEEVAKIWFRGMFLTIITLGVYYFWFRASLDRYYAEHTRLGDARGKLEVVGADYLELFIMTIFLIPMTLGLAAPFIAIKRLQLKLDRLAYFGHIDLETLRQGQRESAPAVSDGIAEIFDVGAGF